MSNFLGHIIIPRKDIEDIESFNLSKYLDKRLERFNEGTKVPEYLTISELPPEKLRDLTWDSELILNINAIGEKLVKALGIVPLKEDDYSKGYDHYFNLFTEMAVVVDSDSNIIKLLQKQVAQPEYDCYYIGGGYIHSQWAFPLKGKADQIELGFSTQGYKRNRTNSNFELRTRYICARIGNIDLDKMQEYLLRENNYMWDCIESVIGNQDLPYAGEDLTKSRLMYNLLVKERNILDYVNRDFADDLLGHTRSISNQNILKKALCPATALIKDDQWYNRPYPLWGKDIENQKIDDWLNTYQSVVGSADPEDYILILQFHS